jgi:hypothetical protein
VIYIARFTPWRAALLQVPGSMLLRDSKGYVYAIQTEAIQQVKWLKRSHGLHPSIPQHGDLTFVHPSAAESLARWHDVLNGRVA